MKTIAVNESTWKKLKELRNRKGVTFEELIEDMMFKTEKIPASMFGSAKGLKPFTRKEREEMWQDENRK